MGIDGIFCTLYLLAIGAELNGASIGGIFTVVGFSATGKTLRNITPIMLGITLLAALSGNYTVTDPAVVLALMFGTTIAPIAGQYGFFGRHPCRFPPCGSCFKHRHCLLRNEPV